MEGREGEGKSEGGKRREEGRGERREEERGGEGVREVMLVSGT